jgi:hypothetical protein
MRDKRDGQIILELIDGSFLPLSYNGASYEYAPGVVRPKGNIYAPSLEPFNGTVTLSNS